MSATSRSSRSSGGTAVAEVRGRSGRSPSSSAAALPQGHSPRHAEEAAEWRERRRREVEAVETCRQLARGRGLVMKVVDVEMEPARRRITVFFNAEERVDFRDLVRDLAHELHARIEMRQIGARDTTKLMDGIGPCGRELCCASHLQQVRPDLGEDGQGAGHAAHGQPAARQLRSSQVLSPLRVLDLRGAALAPAARQYAVLGLLRRQRVHDGQGSVPPRAQAERGGGLSRTGPRRKCRSTSSRGKAATTSSFGLDRADPWNPRRFYLTTPIYYVNARPHLGHASPRSWPTPCAGTAGCAGTGSIS